MGSKSFTNDDGAGIVESKNEALGDYGVKSIEKINIHFARRFYEFSLDKEELLVSLERDN